MSTELRGPGQSLVYERDREPHDPGHKLSLTHACAMHTHEGPRALSSQTCIS